MSRHGQAVAANIGRAGLWRATVAAGGGSGGGDAYADTVDGTVGPITAPPDSHWRFGEEGGNLFLDRKAAARHATINGSVLFQQTGLPENSDPAVDLAAAGYGELPHDSGLALSAFSLSFWLLVRDYPSTEGNGREVFVSKGQTGDVLGDFDVTIEDDGSFIIQFQTGTGQFDLPIKPNVTINVAHHVVVRADGTGFDGYFDGLYLGKNTNHTDAWTSNTQPLRFGAATWNVAEGSTWPNNPVLADAIIDEVALYPRVITEAEVLALAQYNKAPIANPDTFVVPEEATTVLDVVSNDQYAGQKSALTVEVSPEPVTTWGASATTAHGTATVRGDKNIDFVAGSVAQNEADAFNSRITDAFGVSAAALASLTVQDAGAGGGGPGDDGLGGTLIYDWAPLAAWIDDVPLANRDTNDIAVSGRTDWWVNGATTGGGALQSMGATGINRLCWNRAPSGHPSLEIRTASGSNAALGITLAFAGGFDTNPRHLRVVIELKLCNTADPTTYKLNGFDPSAGAYPSWQNTHSNPNVGGKYFFGQWMGGGTDGSCVTNWWAKSNFPIGRGSHRCGWNGGAKGINTYSYNYGRDTACGAPTDYLSPLRMTSPGIATGWHRVESEIKLTNPSLANSTWGQFGTKPSGGDGFNKIFITPDIDQEVGVPAVRVLHSNLQNIVFNTTMNNYHRTVSLRGCFLNLYYGGIDPASASAWSWIRRIKIFRYTEDDI